MLCFMNVIIIIIITHEIRVFEISENVFFIKRFFFCSSFVSTQGMEHKEVGSIECGWVGRDDGAQWQVLLGKLNYCYICQRS